MKWIILLILLLFLFAMIAVRYRRQIRTGIEIWKMFRQMRSGIKPEKKQFEKTETAKDAALVRCARCGTWVPQGKALNLRSKIFYCSTVCIEKSVKV